jgi:hypothetical protein
MEANCRQEVIALHQFFQDWFNADLPHSRAAFARFSDALDGEFYIIGPDGRLTTRQLLLDNLWTAHGQWVANKGSITIKNFVLRRKIENFSMATYEEWQTVETAGQGRLSSVLFASDLAVPSRLLWLSVHETWLPTEHR